MDPNENNVTQASGNINLNEIKSSLEMLQSRQEKLETVSHEINAHEEMGKLKEAVKQMERKQAEFEAVTRKTSATMELLKPDFIVKLKQQDVALNSLNLRIESLNKFQDTILDELKKLKEKLKFYNYRRVVEIDDEASNKLIEIEKFSAIAEKDARKVESLFTEFSRRYVEFKKFKLLENKLEKAFKKDKKHKDKLLDFLMKEIPKLKQDIKGTPKKKGKAKTGWWFLNG